MRGLGHERLACFVAHHSGADPKAALRGLSEELVAFPQEQSPVAGALTYCEVTIGVDGQRLSLNARLDDIERRYGREQWCPVP